MTKPLSRILPLVALITLTAAACGNSTTASRAPQPSADAFVLTEWSVTAPTNPVYAGSQNVTASNQGHETHELVIVRAANAAALPKKPDGSVDEDKIPESDKVGEIASVSASKKVTKAFNLSAGNYVALCNIVDRMGAGNGDMGGMGMNIGGTGMSHTHFALGMVTTFTVI